MIELAPDNHISTLYKLPKKEQKEAERWGNLVTIEEFKELIETSMFIFVEEYALWACFHDGDCYTGAHIHGDYDDNIMDKPSWATHVYWYGK